MTTEVKTTEVWMEAAGFHGVLLVSNLGNFRTIERIVKNGGGGTKTIPAGNKTTTFHKKTGYLHLRIKIDGILHSSYAHRIVLTTFKPTNDSIYQVNHIDMDKHNNRLDNLEWVTASENVQKAWDATHTARAAKRSATSGQARKIMETKSLTDAGFTIREINELTGYSLGSITIYRRISNTI